MNRFAVGPVLLGFLSKDFDAKKEILFKNDIEPPRNYTALFHGTYSDT